MTTGTGGPAVDRGRDFTTYALVLPFGANVLEVLVHPRGDVPRVAAALHARGLRWSPALMGPEGQAGGLLIFDDDDFLPEEVGAVADGLVHEGVGAFGYVRDRESSDAFRRAGGLSPLSSGATVFLRGYRQPGEEGIVVYAFGSHRALLTMAELLPRYFTGTAVRQTDDDGLCGLCCEMPGAGAEGLFAGIERGMHAQGWDVHTSLVTPRRP